MKITLKIRFKVLSYWFKIFILNIYQNQIQIIMGRPGKRPQTRIVYQTPSVGITV